MARQRSAKPFMMVRSHPWRQARLNNYKELYIRLYKCVKFLFACFGALGYFLASAQNTEPEKALIGKWRGRFHVKDSLDIPFLFESLTPRVRMPKYALSTWRMDGNIPLWVILHVALGE
jgi:hypothetical protein